MAMTSFARIDAKPFAATKASGLISTPGCGKCMTALTAEATETECLPLAQSLLRHGLANSVFSRLAAAKQKSDLTCVIYEPTDDQDGSMGRCGQYESRPVMCRLFGSLGELSQVGTQIDLTPARILADELLRLRSSSENPSELKPMPLPMPINEALSRALSLELTKSMHEDATAEAEDEDIAQLELKQWAAARVAAKEA
jgi:Fe-S-cluster containining protein